MSKKKHTNQAPQPQAAQVETNAAPEQNQPQQADTNAPVDAAASGQVEATPATTASQTAPATETAAVEEVESPKPTESTTVNTEAADSGLPQVPATGVAPADEPSPNATSASTAGETQAPSTAPIASTATGTEASTSVEEEPAPGRVLNDQEQHCIGTAQRIGRNFHSFLDDLENNISKDTRELRQMINTLIGRVVDLVSE